MPRVFSLMEQMLAQQAGAETSEEIAHYFVAQDYLQTNRFRNYEIRFREDESGQKKRIVIIYTYTDRTQIEFEESLPTTLSLAQLGYKRDEDGDVGTEEEIGICDDCEKHIIKAKLIHIVDSGEDLCPDCVDRDNDIRHCEHCGNNYSTSDGMEEVYDEDTRDYVGYWCDDCIQEHQGYWDDEDEREYVKIGGTMQQYLIEDGVLARGQGKDCHECSESPEGCCERHMKEKIKEINKEATTLWVYDTKRRNYHEGSHNRFKRLKYRMPNEHPYLYYGIELEVLWDGMKGTYDRVTEEFIRATEGMFVAEYDRSVDERGQQLGHFIGAEFISRPTSYKRWIDKDTITKLEKGMKVLEKYGAFQPQDEGCGLHVHMSLAFFEKNTKKTKSNIKSDMDWFFQYFQKEIEQISRRKYTKYCASKAFRLKHANDNNRENTMFGIKGKIQLEKGELTKSQGSGITHHDCIIQTNKTIEARTFKSTIDVKEILATIEFCRGLAHAARKREGLMGRTFGDILFSKDDKFLTEYVKKLKIDTSRKMKNKIEVEL